MKYIPHNYQDFATQHVVDNPYSGLFLDMGLGKTVSTLTAVNRLMYEDFEVDKVLVIAPKRVAEDTWTTEATKWDHLKHLRVSVVLGSEGERKAALRAKADVYVINRENVAWLVGFYQSAFPFDMVVIDELSSFKSSKSIRFKALRMVRPKMKRVVGLTGTPAPNGLIDLWPQLYLLDMGERLGKTITGYRQQYFTPGRTNGQVVFDYKLRNDSEERIYERISDICISMKAEDYLELPECIYQTVKVKLSPKEKAKYDAFEKEQILALEDAEDISAVNAAALTNKLQQFANGAVYDEERNVHEIHTAKLETLEEIMEEANGKGVLCFYNFKHDLSRIERKLKSYKPVRLEGSKDIAAWNRREIELYLAHPASAGHGLNLQEGGDVIAWFGPTWSLELWLQANARLKRQGRKRPVLIIVFVAEGTIDEDIMTAVDGKKDKQDILMEAVKARIRKYKK